MQKIKNKCLRAAARLKNSSLTRKGMLALAAVTVATGDAMAASKGAAGFTKATQEVSSYQTPVFQSHEGNRSRNCLSRSV